MYRATLKDPTKTLMTTTISVVMCQTLHRTEQCDGVCENMKDVCNCVNFELLYEIKICFQQ